MKIAIFHQPTPKMANVKLTFHHGRSNRIRAHARATCTVDVVKQQIYSKRKRLAKPHVIQLFVSDQTRRLQFCRNDLFQK